MPDSDGDGSQEGKEADRHEAEDQCEKQNTTLSGQIRDSERNNQPTSAEVGTSTEKDSLHGAVSLLSRVMRVAQRYLFNPLSRQSVESKSPQTPAMVRQPSPGRVLQHQTSTSLTRSQVKLKRWSQQKGSTHHPVAQGSAGGVTITPVTVKVSPGCEKTERCERTFRRSATGPVAKVAHRRSNHSIIHHVRAKSQRCVQNEKGPQTEMLHSSSDPPSSQHSSTVPPSCPQQNGTFQGGEQNQTANMALIRELSSRHQTSLPFRNVRESKLI